jgi:hypothetical protein
MSGELWAIDTDGSVMPVRNDFQGIKAGCGGATIDFVRPHEQCGFYIDDEGMLTGQRLNVVVSLMAGMALYGPAVLCAADPDEDGETLPPSLHATAFAKEMGARWRAVTKDAEMKGQDPYVTANADTIPPARIVSWDDPDAFLRDLFGGPDD